MSRREYTDRVARARQANHHPPGQLGSHGSGNQLVGAVQAARHASRNAARIVINKLTNSQVSDLTAGEPKQSDPPDSAGLQAGSSAPTLASVSLPGSFGDGSHGGSSGGGDLTPRSAPGDLTPRGSAESIEELSAKEITGKDRNTSFFSSFARKPKVFNITRKNSFEKIGATFSFGGCAPPPAQ